MSANNEYIKYIKYKKKYLDLKFQHSLINLIGGQLCSNDTLLDYGNIDTLLMYLKKEKECTEKHSTKNKYLIISYGPPASGKTEAISVGCNLIKEYFNEDLSVDDIMSTLINTGVDDLVYRLNVGDTPTKEKLINNLVDKIKERLRADGVGDSSQLSHVDELLKDTSFVNELAGSSYKIYDASRRIIDPISSLLLWFASYLNKNIIFEIASGDFNYIDTTIHLMNYNGYIPVVVYPYTNNLNVIYGRNLDRAKREGRLISRDFIKARMQANIGNFNIVIDNFATNYKSIPNMIIASYDNSVRAKGSRVDYNNLIIKKSSDGEGISTIVKTKLEGVLEG